MQSKGKVLQRAIYASNQHPVHDAVSPIAQIHKCRNQGLELGVVPLTIALSDPLAKFLLPVPAVLCSAGLEVLVSKRDTATIPLNWKLRLLPGHFELLMPLNQWARKGVTMLAGVIGPKYVREIGGTPPWRLGRACVKIRGSLKKL